MVTIVSVNRHVRCVTTNELIGANVQLLKDSVPNNRAFVTPAYDSRDGGARMKQEARIEAGVQEIPGGPWIPAYAGMTAMWNTEAFSR